MICLDTPEDFYAVGQFYGEFHQVPDEEVEAVLAAEAKPARETGAE